MGIELKKFDHTAAGRGSRVQASRPVCGAVLPADWRRSRNLQPPLTRRDCRCCSRDRRDAARRASSSIWRINCRRSPTAPTNSSRSRVTRISPAANLVGRFLIQADETVWVDGPLTQAVRRGAICYLDEVVEARKDTTVLIHPLSDHRRILPIESAVRRSRRTKDFCW